MKSRINRHISRIIPIILFSVILSNVACDRSYEHALKNLDVAESIMESRPDSALALLNSIDEAQLKGKSRKARYALLKSMALDKNYVDTTTFDILQPAIEYYLKKGTPDEKLRTYYYQGRIYQNKNERDSAVHSFMKGLDISGECRDSMTIARMLVAQGILFQSFYDYYGYSNNYLEAAHIFKNKSLDNLEFDCLLNALNGMVILKNKHIADSITKLIDKFKYLNDIQIKKLQSDRLSYILQFGSLSDIKDLIEKNDIVRGYDMNGILNLALAYNKLGDNGMALQQLDYLDQIKIGYDTLKYLSIRFRVLEDLDRHEEALSAYKDFSHRLEIINADKFEQKSMSMEEKHRMEMQAEMDTRKNMRIIWGCIGGIVFLAMGLVILTLLVRRNKARKDLALEKARTAGLENENLKAERERLSLENSNLQLERDKKVLEAENLAHRVETLESESESLKALLESSKEEEIPSEVQKAIQTRIRMLNSLLAGYITDNDKYEKPYDEWVREITEDSVEFMNSNRLAFQASHPRFIRYFEEHGLTISEINYVCLYAIGLRGKEVGNYIKKRSHVNTSSAIRKKLGIDKHETNLGIYVRNLLRDL